MSWFVQNEPHLDGNERLLCRRHLSPTSKGWDMATNKEIIESGYASFAKGDVPGALNAFADDIRWVEPEGHPLGGTYVGHQAVVDGVFMRLAEIGDEFAVVPDRFIADGDTVVALGHLSWKQKSSGAPAKVETVHVWTFDGGKAATFQQHVDTVRVRELM
jgi:ketosteroid isomerase-like protein